MEKQHYPASFQVGLKVLMVNEAGEFLLLKASSDKVEWEGTFDFPGGRINKDELDLSFHKIIDREIAEEVGAGVKYQLRPDPVSLAKVQYDGEVERFFVLFEAKYLSGKIELSEEHTDYEWKKVNETDISKIFPTVFQELMYNYFMWNK